MYCWLDHLCPVRFPRFSLLTLKSFHSYRLPCPSQDMVQNRTKERRYAFDIAYGKEATSKDVYKETCAELVSVGVRRSCQLCTSMAHRAGDYDAAGLLSEVYKKRLGRPPGALYARRYD